VFPSVGRVGSGHAGEHKLQVSGFTLKASHVAPVRMYPTVTVEVGRECFESIKPQHYLFRLSFPSMSSNRMSFFFWKVQGENYRKRKRLTEVGKLFSQ